MHIHIHPWHVEDVLEGVERNSCSKFHAQFTRVKYLNLLTYY